MQAVIDTVLEVDTPEHLAFRTRIAGPGRRMFAWLVDLLVRALILFLLAIAVNVIFGSVSLDGVGSGLILVAFFTLDWGYFVVSEHVTGGRSIGKIALKLRVVRTNGIPITLAESSLRNLVRAADLALFPPYFLLIGPLVMALDTKFRRLGDLVAGTVVVVEDRAGVTSKAAIPPDPAVLEELPATLPLDHEDLEALELFVNREYVSDARRAELAEIVAPVYAKRLALARPRDPTAFLASLWVRAQDPRRNRGVP